VREGDQALVEHGQAADAGVEHPDRARIHGRILRAPGDGGAPVQSAARCSI
jgi:hypothetical protein